MELLSRIRDIFIASEGTYGAPRVHAALAGVGVRTSRKRVARLMKADKLKARAARIYRAQPGNWAFYRSIPNRVLKATTRRCDQIWVGDVTYLKVSGRWRFLAVVMDRHSRRVLGWSLGLQRDLKLTLAALNEAIARRKPRRGLTFHSDRGIEYTANVYRARLAAHGIVQSTNRPREITDNACMESFWHSLKSELTDDRVFTTDQDLDAALVHFMWRYNNRRLHSALGYRTPIDYERLAA